MPSLLIDPEILAQRLEAAANRYDEIAAQVAQDEEERVAHLADQFKRQAAESREWAAAIRGANTLSWEGSHIEVGF